MMTSEESEQLYEDLVRLAAMNINSKSAQTTNSEQLPNTTVRRDGQMVAAAAEPIPGIPDYGEIEPASQPEPLPAEVREGIAKGVYPPW